VGPKTRCDYRREIENSSKFQKMTQISQYMVLRSMYYEDRDMDYPRRIWLYFCHGVSLVDGPYASDHEDSYDDEDDEEEGDPPCTGLLKMSPRPILPGFLPPDSVIPIASGFPDPKPAVQPPPEGFLNEEYACPTSIFDDLPPKTVNPQPDIEEAPAKKQRVDVPLVIS
jgi:hypothetical protein